MSEDRKEEGKEGYQRERGREMGGGGKKRGEREEDGRETQIIGKERQRN